MRLDPSSLLQCSITEQGEGFFGGKTGLEEFARYRDGLADREVAASGEAFQKEGEGELRGGGGRCGGGGR